MFYFGRSTTLPEIRWVRAAAPSAAGHIWFPIALIPLTYFGGRPFDRLGQPYAGLAYAGATFIGTVIFAGILTKSGIDFFGEGVAGEKGNILVATWTDVGLVAAWLFNMWPLGKAPQPLKGILATLGTLGVSLAIYAFLVNGFGEADYPAVVFGLFCFLWAQVSFAGIGLFDVFTWGYEEDPAGAGPQFVQGSPLAGEPVVAVGSRDPHLVDSATVDR